MIDIQRSLDVENIYDLVRKEIHGRYETYNPAEQQIRKYKRYGSERFKDDKYLYAHQDIITLQYCIVKYQHQNQLNLGLN